MTNPRLVRGFVFWAWLPYIEQMNMTGFIRLFTSAGCPWSALRVWLLGSVCAVSLPLAWAQETPASPARMTLVLSGVQGSVADNVRAWLPSLPLCDSQPLQQLVWGRQARKAALNALQALGHFSAQVRVQPSASESGCGQMQLLVTAGEPVRYRQVVVRLEGEGQQDAALAERVAGHGLLVGEPLHQGRYETFKAELSSLLQARGYFDARFTRQEIRVDPQAGTADVFLLLASGSRYRLGELRLHQDFLDPAFVHRYVQLKPGQTFEAEALASAAQRLNASGYFDDVRVRQQRDDAFPGEVPVDIHLSPRKRMRYAFSVGYGSDTGERVGAEVERRWVNRQGHVWSGDVQVAQKRQLLESHYVVPLDNPLKDHLDWLLRVTYEENDVWGRGSHARLGPQYVHELEDGWTGAAFVELMSARTEFFGDPVREGQFLMAGVRLSKRQADDLISPRHGWRLDMELKGAEGSLFSSTSLVQAQLGLKGIMPLGKGSLLGRVELGSTWVPDFDRLPKPLRFFTGGDTTVRGFGYERLGPENAQGRVIGGQHLLVGSVEYEHPVRDNWRLALFYDTGNAFNDWEKDLGSLRQSVGFGGRWQSPVGAVKVDLAWPMMQSDVSGPRLHLGIGVPL